MSVANARALPRKVARKLVKQEDQRERAPGFGFPIVELAGGGAVVVLKKFVGAHLVEHRVSHKPHSPILSGLVVWPKPEPQDVIDPRVH